MMTYYDQYLAPHLEMVRGIVRRHSYPASEAADNFQSVVLRLLEHLEDVVALAARSSEGGAIFDPRPWISAVTLHTLSTLNHRALRHRATHLTPSTRPAEEGAHFADNGAADPCTAADSAPHFVLDNETVPSPLVPCGTGAPDEREQTSDRCVPSPTDNDNCLEMWHMGQRRPGFHRTKAGRLWTAMRRRARQRGSAFGYVRVLDARWARAVSGLGTEARSVLLLHADGWRSGEIASAMGLSAPSVRQLLSRGRARLARIRDRPCVFRRKDLAD